MMQNLTNPDRRLAWAALSAVFAAGVFAAPTVPPSPNWKSTIVFPDEPFRVKGDNADDPDWIKFTILKPPYDPNIVYFQNSNVYEFHYGFAAEELPPFRGMTPEQYDLATLYKENQQAVIGAVIMPPSTGYPPPPEYPEYGIQLIRRDPFTPEETLYWLEIVKSSIAAGPEVQTFYFPSYEQNQVARDNRAWFESQGFPVGSADRWSQGNVVYSEGWALGRLKFVSADLIRPAYLAGSLRPHDILLTDAIPAEIPSVAGIISLSPSTPNSHVAILAKTFNVPFAYMALPEDANNAQAMVGKRVVLRAYDDYYSPDVQIIKTEGVLSEEQTGEILQLKELPPLDIAPIQTYGSYVASTEGLIPADIKYFGGKAANFGFLRRSIPNNCPSAIAISFDLWTEFLEQSLPGGLTLREEIDARLAQFTWPPQDMAALSAQLAAIRSMFEAEHLTQFTTAQRMSITDALLNPQYGFDMNRRIRFRSSTNVEDSDQFTGAGLYDSYSGCLADDLDADSIGPSICDPTRSNERGVFRAIRKVFASFYNDNAFLERLRYGVNEHEVGMALLVHHSFPDEIELANGVATLKMGSGYPHVEMVTQKGAVSVSNPTDGSIPEEVEATIYSFGTYPTLLRQSNLVPLGATVLEWQDEYLELCNLLKTAADHYSATTGQNSFLLDFEYKKTAPDGKLVVKQIRKIPQPRTTQTVTPFMIGQATEYCTFQGEYGDIFSNHRLKCRVTLEAGHTWLSQELLAQSFYSAIMIEYAARGRARWLSANVPTLPYAKHTFTPGTVPPRYDATIHDEWLMHHLANQRQCRLETTGIPTAVRLSRPPVLTPLDLGALSLKVDYERAVPTYDWQGIGKTKTDRVRLVPRPVPQIGDLPQNRLAQGSDSRKPRSLIRIETSFYWPPPPTGAVAGYTAPLVRWQQTTISGYTSEPIVLTDWYAQTYRPGHHNFSETFLFEPRLDPGVSPEMLAELKQRDIRLILLQIGGLEPTIMSFGFDEQPFLPGDIDDSGAVDFDDLAILASRWLDRSCDTCQGADLDGDARVNLSDAAELARTWLAGM